MRESVRAQAPREAACQNDILRHPNLSRPAPSARVRGPRVRIVLPGNDGSPSAHRRIVQCRPVVAKEEADREQGEVRAGKEGQIATQGMGRGGV